jgi:hypothetical protein
VMRLRRWQPGQYAAVSPVLAGSREYGVSGAGILQTDDDGTDARARRH